MKNRVLAKALEELHSLQKGANIFRSEDFTGKNMTYLRKGGYLKSIIRGWYYQTHPADREGDTTTWYAGYWEFVAKYLESRFGGEYCLNPEISLLLQTKNSVIPKQVVAVTTKGAVGKVALLYGGSLFIYPEKKVFPTEIVKLNGLNLYGLEESLCRVGKLFFQKNQNEVEIALNMIKDVSSLLYVLLSANRMDDACSRIAGALKFVGREEEALRIKESYEMATFKNVSLKNPFVKDQPILNVSRERNPYALRLQSMWKQYRLVVLKLLEDREIEPREMQEILQEMNEKYQFDAYHSLSIEGYKVTKNLIDCVANGEWSPEGEGGDGEIKNALAAKGYYLAFEAVKKSIMEAMENQENISSKLASVHHVWYRELFMPSITSGILKAQHLAGYRNHQVYLRGSQHVPFPKEALADAMEVYFELLEQEDNPLVKAILGHHMFGYIHPYMDGNGRIARFIMNAMLVSDGYPWLVIEVDQREAYMQALEEASVHQNIEMFAMFVLELLE